MVVHKKAGFDPAPPGLHKAVCVDVSSKLMKSKFDVAPVEKVKLTFEIEKTMTDGRRFIAATPPMRPSLNEKSIMLKTLSSWSVATSDTFDLETLIGRGALIMVSHRENGGQKYADVVLVTPDPGEPLKPSGGYVRVRDRQE